MCFLSFRLVYRHVCPPAGLATRHTAAGNKLLALFHQLYMESNEPSFFALIVKCMVALTPDYGPESKVRKVPHMRFEEAFSHLHQFEFEDESCNAPASSHTADNTNPTLSTDHWVICPGNLHILGTGILNMMKGMRNYSDIHQQVSDAVGFFC